MMREILPVLDWLVQVHACFRRQCRGDDKEDLEEVKALMSLACVWSTTTPFLFDTVLEMNIPV